MALDITFACDPANRNLTIEISNPGGKYKLLGSNTLGMGSPNSLGGNDHNFTLLVQQAGSGNPDPISFVSTQIIAGTNIECNPSSNDQIEVIVMEYTASYGGTTKCKKKTKITVS
ncbi:MAG: hypothetical protein ACJAU0_001592 [Flavobacteriales bacterium]|jgi:hypothetical protein